MDITRGTTPTIIFESEDPVAFSEIWWTIQQNHTGITYKKSLNQLAVDEEAKRISVTMTQKDTLMFDSNKEVEMQIRAIDGDNTSVATEVFSVSVNKILKGGVINGITS